MTITQNRPEATTMERPPADRDPRYTHGRVWGLVFNATLIVTVAAAGIWAGAREIAEDQAASKAKAASCAQALTAADEISTLSRANWTEIQEWVNAGERRNVEAVANLEAVVSTREQRLERLQATYNTHRKDCTR